MTNGSEDVTTELFLGTKVNGGTAGVRFGFSCPILLKKEAAVKSTELKKHLFLHHFF